MKFTKMVKFQNTKIIVQKWLHIFEFCYLGFLSKKQCLKSKP